MLPPPPLDRLRRPCEREVEPEQTDEEVRSTARRGRWLHFARRVTFGVGSPRELQPCDPSVPHSARSAGVRPAAHAGGSDVLRWCLQVDVVGGVGSEDDETSDLEDPTDRQPRRTRYDCGFVLENLWRSRNNSGSAGIRIPETVVFKNSNPTHWYFTRPHDGRIMKRNLGQEQFITPTKILEVFEGTTGEIVAVFVNFKEIEGKRVSTTIDFFDRAALRDFLYTPVPDRNGLLQKFLSIRQQKFENAAATNQTLHMLHVTWKKGELRTTKVTQRAHFLRIVEPGQDFGNSEMKSYRYATADPVSYAHKTLPSSSHTSLRIREACERIAEHLRVVTDNAVRMTHFAGFFKVGHKGQLWFNFPTSVDVEDWGVEHTLGLPASVPVEPTADHRRPPDNESKTGSTPRAPHVPVRKSPGKVDDLNRHKTGDTIRHKTGETIMCPFCKSTIERPWPASGGIHDNQPHEGCTLTRYEIILFLERCSEQRESSCANREPQILADRAADLWRNMRLRAEDEITLANLRAKMRQLDVSPELCEKIETGIALSDTHIRGVVDFSLWCRGVTYSAESHSPTSGYGQSNTGLMTRAYSRVESLFPRETNSPSSPLQSLGEKQGKVFIDAARQELLDKVLSNGHNLDAASSMIRQAKLDNPRNQNMRRNSTEPVFATHLRAALGPKLLSRMTAPGVLEQESHEFLRKTAEVCPACYQSVKMYLLDKGNMETDAHMEILLRPVSVPRNATSSPGLYQTSRLTRVDRMWSRFQEMRKGPDSPSMKPAPHTSSTAIRASENDFAGLHRISITASLGIPRSPLGNTKKKPWGSGNAWGMVSPKSRQVENSLSRHSHQVLRIGTSASSDSNWPGLQSVRDSPLSACRPSNSGKILQDVSDLELLRELESRGLSSVSGKDSSLELFSADRSNLLNSSVDRSNLNAHGPRISSWGTPGDDEVMGNTAKEQKETHSHSR